MSQDNKVVQLSASKHKELTNKGRIVYAYHAFQNGNSEEGIKLLTAVSQDYYMAEIYKDLAKALLAWSIYRTCNGVNADALYKEAEFYIVLHRTTRFIVDNGFVFNKSGYFHDVDKSIFQGFSNGSQGL